MRKILYTLPLLLILLFPVHCSASSFAPSAQALSSFAEFVGVFPTFHFQSYGYDLGESQTLEECIYSLNGTTYDNSNPVFSYTDLSSTNWIPEKNFYDSNGNVVPSINCCLAVGSTDLVKGYFIFDKSSGEILRVGDSFSTSESTLMGEATSTLLNVENELDSFFDAYGYLAWFNTNLLTSEQLEYLSTLPYACWGYSSQYGADMGFYIADVGHSSQVYADAGKIYTTQAGNYLLNWWNNKTTGGSSGVIQGLNPEYGQNTFLGRFYYVYPRSGASWSWWDSYHFVSTPSYDILSGEDVSFFSPAESFTIGNTLLADAISIGGDVVRPWDIAYNPDFDNTSDLSGANFPLNYTFDNSYVFDPTYNYYYDYTYENDTPNTGEIIADIPNIPIPTDLPLLNNLAKRFPFSIPFDLYNMLSGLSATRVAPSFSYVINVPMINYDWEVDIDLSMYDDVASMFRICFLILFIIGLAIFSYNHFFGS